ncbi:MAG: hypothetical protein ACP5VR_11045 [Acidimicrobiales bacterium]
MFVFAYCRTSGATLTVLMIALAVFALDLSAQMAFTLARSHEVSSDDRP